MCLPADLVRTKKYKAILECIMTLFINREGHYLFASSNNFESGNLEKDNGSEGHTFHLASISISQLLKPFFLRLKVMMSRQGFRHKTLNLLK